MRASIGCGVVLLSVLGNVTEAAGVSEAVLAGNRGLSPIITAIIIPNSGSLISNVLIGGTGAQNPLKNFTQVLNNLGIATGQHADHQNHFHVYLSPPTIQAIVDSMNLLAPEAASADVIDGSAASLAISSTETTTYSALSGVEEVVMLAFTVPAEPPSPPALIAQASVQSATPKQDMNTITFCRDKQSAFPLFNEFSPISDEFLQQIGAKHGFTIEELKPYHVTLVTPPQHGQIQLLDEQSHYWSYVPTKDYTGADRVIYLVQNQGKQYKVVVNFWVVEVIDENRTVQECESIKFGTPNGPSTTVSGLTAISLSDFEAWQREAQLASLINTISNVTISFANLSGAAIGQTDATGITLDTNASGYGWFIDTTPADNSEFLPTSNPYEWVAKAGSAAAGKMDMLSVLLHEYGHALGINHSADPNDFMGTTLTAGVRKLPSAEEMALMQGLVAEAKATLTESTPSLTLPLQGGGDAPAFPTIPLGTSFIGFLGLLRGSRYGGVSIAPDASTLVTQYDWAANATLTNGSLNAADGWSTQGSVNIGSGAAVMNEISGSQTRLSQVFMLNPTDRFLSFTLSGTALDDLTGAPDDAFEVALLDANTGASLLSGTGQTRTDAFLNLQADGTQNLANCVTCINNADGSRTYRVDLAGVPAGTAANLSFDLIGFGQNNSQVTVSDVRLSGLPQLHDEAATMLEDGTLAFDPFAQVDNAAVLQLGSHVVDQPAHGAVSVNADGTT